MNKPLIWNSLNDAVKWLSSKTGEEWSASRIIDFCINDLERKRSHGAYPSARIKVALPGNVRVGIYRRKDDVEELAGKFFPKVAGGNLVRFDELGSKHRFVASLYLHNLYELLLRHETEITAISRDEDSFPFSHFELFEPISEPSAEWLESTVHICGGKL